TRLTRANLSRLSRTRCSNPHGALEPCVGNSCPCRTPATHYFASSCTAYLPWSRLRRRHEHTRAGLPRARPRTGAGQPWSHALSITRRDFIIGTTALGAGASISAPFFLPKYHFNRRPKRSRVAILPAAQYSQELDQVLLKGLQLFPLDVRGKTVVLKPNLVDYLPGDAINTHP